MIVVTWHRAWLCLTWLLLAAPSFVRAQPSAEEDAIYGYMDDRGRLMHAQRMKDIPLHLRSSARRVDVQAEGAPDPSKSDQLIEWLSHAAGGKPGTAQEAALYRYRGANGQPVYTNLASSVPSDQRAQAKVDLSHVPLNSELGTAINKKLLERFEALRTSEACAKATSEAQLPWWERAWRDQRVLVVCGGVMLLLLLLVPFMHSRGWGGPWARVLFTAVPMLTFVALSATLLMKGSASVTELAPNAKRCTPTAFQNAEGLQQRFSLVSALEREQQALAQIAQEGSN